MNATVGASDFAGRRVASWLPGAGVAVGEFVALSGLVLVLGWLWIGFGAWIDDYPFRYDGPNRAALNILGGLAILIGMVAALVSHALLRLLDTRRIWSATSAVVVGQIPCVVFVTWWLLR